MIHKNNKLLWATEEEINILLKMVEKLYEKKREIIKNKGQQGWWDYFLEWLGY